tara:strand:- start:118 stop:246 length:129 start_codon:yes stop_codon:yes gene_type:complete
LVGESGQESWAKMRGANQHGANLEGVIRLNTANLIGAEMPNG